MVPPRCMVSYCSNQGKHKFPKDESRRKLWLEAIKDVKRQSAIGTYSGLCSDHFRLSDYSVIPSYWNNYHPARILKKSAVPSVFNSNKTMEDDQQSSLIEDTVLSDLLFVEVDEPTTVQDTVSFNPERVKATYSRGQTLKSPKKPNALPSQKNKQTQNKESTITIQNAKNISYSKSIIKKRPAHNNIDHSNKSDLIHQNNDKTQSNTKLTSSFQPEGIIKTEQIEVSYKTQDRLIPEITINTEPDKEKPTIFEIEIDMLQQIKQETNEEIADVNL